MKPFVKSQKNDALDAEAICEAALRLQMRFVRPNTVEQQDLQNIHRVRERLVKQRVALTNQILGLLLEYGIVVPKGAKSLTEKLASLVDVPDVERSLWKDLFADLREELLQLTCKIAHYNNLLKRISQAHPICQRLEQLPGVGVMTSTAIVASVNNPHDFNLNGAFESQISAYMTKIASSFASFVPTLAVLGFRPKNAKYFALLARYTKLFNSTAPFRIMVPARLLKDSPFLT